MHLPLFDRAPALYYGLSLALGTALTLIFAPLLNSDISSFALHQLEAGFRGSDSLHSSFGTDAHHASTNRTSRKRSERNGLF